jgi:hypothetical protein
MQLLRGPEPSVSIAFRSKTVTCRFRLSPKSLMARGYPRFDRASL